MLDTAAVGQSSAAVGAEEEDGVVVMGVESAAAACPMGPALEPGLAVVAVAVVVVALVVAVEAEAAVG